MFLIIQKKLLSAGPTRNYTQVTLVFDRQNIGRGRLKKKWFEVTLRSETKVIEECEDGAKDERNC